ncbi:SRPBCC family protein [Pollutimonas harenae]|uniref:SRPBCC family protein n=1 Tax=Pollutimonas harenae TaxID=657015 RepID=A0A853GR42_9BURK|nr:SRPBCC family protein [Pollutimonas harenae]NYT84627.1 SRPBCC family protein [Pollutimonas harenae]TEA72965.1 SRPBCC family protein [Pollutimonas harenae]
MKIYVSSVIHAPAHEVWSVIRDFNGLPRWTPFVAHSRVEGNLPSDAVGCVRNFELRQGGAIREQLLALSDYDFTCIYSILESPMGVHDYVATLKVTPITDGDHSFIEWSAEFACEPGREDELRILIGQEVFLAALKSLRTIVEIN